MKTKLKLGLTLFLIGFLGILSFFSIDLPANITESIPHLSPIAVKLLVLLNPTILLSISVVIGTILYDKVNLSVPTISSLLKIEKSSINFYEQLKFGCLLGCLAGVLVLLDAFVFKSIIAQELTSLGNGIEPNLLNRFLYGGFTEEILMRFGLMTLFVWIAFKITKKLNNLTYWFAIILSSLLFAFGHFPVVFASVAQPSILLLMYIVIGNSIVGLFCGWLYWKKGLEAAFICHIFTHIILVLLGHFF